jgi:hypothetical protein
MRNLLIAACCVALAGSASVASAQTTGPASQDNLKTNSPMEPTGKAKKKHVKKSMKSDEGMQGGMKKDAK